MQEYLVIGIYDDGQRFAESYETETAEDAEERAVSAHPGLQVAGVLVNGNVVA